LFRNLTKFIEGENNIKEVLDFIKHFNGAEDVFLHGCCYWFAYILRERFHGHGYIVDIYHDPIEGHFVARFIENPNPYEPITPDVEVRFFDIRGDVTDKYKEDDLENVWIMQMTEERRWGRLMCDCREFIEPEDYPAWLKS